jgi:uncharacterized membrane protein YbhN (UPF0104 family)
MSRQSKAAGIKYMLYGVTLGLLAFVLWREQATFVASIRLLGEVNPLAVGLGLAIFLLSVVFATLVYKLLSPKKLAFRPTAEVQLATLAVNKLLPAGSGSLGVNYVYLRKNKLTRALALAVVASNNLLGFVGHLTLLLVVCLLFAKSLPTTGWFSQHNLLLVGTLACWAVALTILAYLAHRWKAPAFWRQLRPLYKRRRQLAVALLASMAVTTVYATALWLAAHSFGVQLSPAVAILVLSFGVAAASAVPVPGGIGAAEAGIFSGLLTYGTETTAALSIAILYRIITFWLPLLIGVVALFLPTPRSLLDFGARRHS